MHINIFRLYTYRVIHDSWLFWVVFIRISLHVYIYIYIYIMSIEATVRRLERCLCIYINYDIYIYRVYKGHSMMADMVGIYIYIHIYYCTMPTLYMPHKGGQWGVHIYMYILLYVVYIENRRIFGTIYAWECIVLFYYYMYSVSGGHRRGMLRYAFMYIVIYCARKVLSINVRTACIHIYNLLYYIIYTAATERWLECPVCLYIYLLYINHESRHHRCNIEGMHIRIWRIWCSVCSYIYIYIYLFIYIYIHTHRSKRPTIFSRDPIHI
jgi:hypothetical protein